MIAILYRPSGEVRNCSCCGPDEAWDSDFQVIDQTDEQELVGLVASWAEEVPSAKWTLLLIPGIDKRNPLEAPALVATIEAKIAADRAEKQRLKEEAERLYQERERQRQEAQERATYEKLREKFG